MGVVRARSPVRVLGGLPTYNGERMGENVSKFYGVKCDRCRDSIIESSASKLDEEMSELGWSARKVGRSLVHFCEPCQEANEELRQAILAKLATV